MPLSFEQFKALRAKGLSPEQIAKFEAGYKPQQKSTFGKIKDTVVDIGRTPGEMNVGFLKSLGRTATGLANAVVKSPLLGAGAFGIDLTKPIKDKVSEQINKIDDEYLKNKNTAQTIGGLAETAAEIFLPLGKVEQATRSERYLNRAKEMLVGTGKKIEEGLIKKGSFETSAITGKTELKADESLTKLAERTKDYFSSGNPAKIAKNVLSGIQNKSEKLGNYLSENSIKYDKGIFRKYLSSAISEVDDALFDPKRIQNAKKQTVDLFMKQLKSDELADLWKSRKSFDYVIDNAMNAFKGSPTLKKDMAKAVRDAANTFIQEHLPDLSAKGGNIYKNAMKDMSDLYRVLEIIAPKIRQELGKGYIEKGAETFLDLPFVKPIMKAVGRSFGVK